MHRRTLAAAVSAVALAGGAAGLGTPAAHADAPPNVEVLADGLVGPLSLAVDSDGTRYVTEDFAGLLDRQVPGGPLEHIYASKHGIEVGGVSAENGVLRFTLTYENDSGSKNTGRLMTLRHNGHQRLVANTGAYERANNPDGNQSYGFKHLGKSCAAQLPDFIGPAEYKGIVETHPYNSALVNGVTYVADAAGNDILRVGPDGAVSTVAVLPPRLVVITADVAAANGLPDCTIGKTYRFEPVPTDVEVGPNGDLFVTTLSGGPEDGSAGPTGQVLRIDPATGKISRVAQGLLGATGVAVASNGDVYASELFAGEIVKIPAGTNTVEPYLSIPLPADVDMASDGLYAVVNVLPGDSGPPDGQLVRITPAS